MYSGRVFSFFLRFAVFVLSLNTYSMMNPLIFQFTLYIEASVSRCPLSLHTCTYQRSNYKCQCPYWYAMVISWCLILPYLFNEQ